jgi:ATP-dependent Lon protease
MRKLARRLAAGEKVGPVITPEDVRELLGRPRVHPERISQHNEVGVAIGMYYTPAGGDIMFVEAAIRLLPGMMAPTAEATTPATGWGSVALILTGQLGEVMKESARAALSWLRTHAREYGIDPDFFKNAEMHVHVPSGAIPKDGPSAGVTMVTAMASELTGRPVRGDIAMTGEITLSGRVLPVGGIKEKVLAARRVGIREVILPKQNAKNVNEDLTPELRHDLTVHLVSTIDEVLALALQPVSSDIRPQKSEPREPKEPKEPKPRSPIAARH